MGRECRGLEQVTSLNSVKTLTLADGTYEAYIQATAQNVYYTLDGSTPSAANGLVLVANAEPKRLLAPLARAAKFLEASASAKLNVQYFGPE